MSRTRLRDPDLRMLRDADKAIEATSSVRMRRATLEYLWDKWVVHADTAPPPPVREAQRPAKEGT